MRFGIDEIIDNLLVAFDIKKVSIQFLGLLFAVFCFAGFSFVANYINPIVLNISWWILGGIIVYSALMLVHGALTGILYEEATSGNKLSIKEAFLTSKNNFKSMFFSPIIFFLCIAAIFGIEYLIFLLGKASTFAVIISLLTLPIVLLNTILLFLVFLEIFLIVEIITVDQTGPLSAIFKIFNIMKKSPAKTVGYFCLLIFIGLNFSILIGSVFFAAAIITLSLFGSASGLFAQLGATEIPYLSRGYQTAYNIFGIFISLILGILISYLLVFIKSNSISIYLSIKDKIK